MNKNFLVFITLSFILSAGFNVGAATECYYDKCKIYPCPTGAVELVQVSCSDSKCNTGPCANNSKPVCGNNICEENEASVCRQLLINNTREIKCYIGICPSDCKETKLSNGKNAETKIMPETASETALQKLKLNVCNESNNCQVELKEVGEKESPLLVYQTSAEKDVKILGIFGIKMNVLAQVDVKTGEILKIKKPWWAFLAW